MILLLSMVVCNVIELYYQYENMSTKIVKTMKNVISEKNVYTSAKKARLGLFCLICYQAKAR